MVSASDPSNPSKHELKRHEKTHTLTVAAAHIAGKIMYQPVESIGSNVHHCCVERPTDNSCSEYTGSNTKVSTNKCCRNAVRATT